MSCRMYARLARGPHGPSVIRFRAVLELYYKTQFFPSLIIRNEITMFRISKTTILVCVHRWARQAMMYPPLLRNVAALSSEEVTRRDATLACDRHSF